MVYTGRISVLVSRELLALITVMRGLPRDIASETRKQIRKVVAPVWSEIVASKATTRLQERVLSETAKVAVSDTQIKLRSAATGRLADGTPVSDIAAGVEFGADREQFHTAHSSKGLAYRRRTERQFRLRRERGYVVWPSAAEIIPRIAALWIQTVVRTIHERVESVSK